MLLPVDRVEGGGEPFSSLDFRPVGRCTHPIGRPDAIGTASWFPGVSQALCAQPKRPVTGPHNGYWLQRILAARLPVLAQEVYEEGGPVGRLSQFG